MERGAGEGNDTDLSGGGNPSYRGYHYQISVSVWAALTLMLRDPAVDSIVIEPASHDDIAVRLDVPAEEAESTLKSSGELLTIQIKFRGSGHWSAKDFAALVNDKPKAGNSGPAVRTRAKSMLLANENSRYILVTNVSVETGLSAGRISNLMDLPDAAFLPTSLALSPSEKVALAGRFGIVEMLSEHQLRSEIFSILDEVGHVTWAKRDTVYTDLRRMVEDRILGLAKPLSRREVESAIESAGGRPQRTRELSQYVPPPVFFAAKELLRREHSVLLSGPPGFGKTLAAKTLVYDLRTGPMAFEVIREKVGAGGIDELLSVAGRHVFFLDDPWGQAHLDEKDASMWNAWLPKLLAAATPDKLFIITSRSDILRSAAVNPEGLPWLAITVSIDAASYTAAEMWKILETKVANGESWHGDFVLRYKDRILEELRSPFTIDQFASALIKTDAPKNAILGKLLEAAQVAGIFATIAEQIRVWPNKGVACATVIWAMLRRSETIDVPRLRLIRKSMEHERPQIELNLTDFAKHLASTSISMENDVLSAHGQVIGALEAAMTPHPDEVERTLNRLSLSLIKLAEADPSFGSDLLKVFDGAKSLKSLGILVDQSVVDAVDKLLLGRLRLATDRRGFLSAFDNVARRVSDRGAAARLCRYLKEGRRADKKNDRPYDAFRWTPPTLSQSELGGIAGDPETEKILIGFISHMLARTHEKYAASDLMAFLELFNIGFGDAFLEACNAVISGRGFMTNADTIFECAVTIHAAPVSDLFQLLLQFEKNVAVINEKRFSGGNPWQGEMDYADQLWAQDTMQEEHASPEYAVKGYVSGRRKQEGHAWIAEHPRPDLIIPAWIEVMRFSDIDPSSYELDACLAVAKSEDLHAKLLQIIGERGMQDEKPRLEASMLMKGTTIRLAAARAYCLMAGSGGLQGRFLELLPATDLIGQIEILAVAGKTGSSTIAKNKLIDALVANANNDTKPVLAFVAAILGNAKQKELGHKFEAIKGLVSADLIEAVPRDIGAGLLAHAVHHRQDVLSLCLRWLRSDNDKDVWSALHALKTIRTTESRHAIRSLTSHGDYSIRRFALTILADGASHEEVECVVSCFRDESAPVREAVASLIGQNAWQAGKPVLFHLLDDRRDYTAHPEYLRFDEKNFQVARAAAAALDAFELSKGDMDTLINFICAGSPDAELRASLTSLLTKAEHERALPVLQSLLADGQVIGEELDPIYPVRYAAAWAIWSLVIKDVDLLEHLDWKLLSMAATHIDPQLAAPCLMILGASLEKPAPEVLVALRAEGTSMDRLALALFMVNRVTRARALNELYGLLPVTHPLLDVSGTEDDTAVQWPVTQAMKDWLCSLDPGQDVCSVLMKAAELLTPIDFGMANVNVTMIRRKERVPIVTMSEMFGME